jgi:hypothetical protein
MRRRAVRAPRVLTAVALTGAALGLVVPGASAAADPSARVEPRDAEPGGTVTVTVSCDAVGATPPASIEATSRGFENGRVMLRRVDATGTALTYTGTARVPADDAPDAVPAPADPADPAGLPDGQAALPGDDPAAPADAGDAAASPGEWSVDGACPAAPGGAGAQWSTSFGQAGGEGVTDPDTGPAQDPPAAVPGTTGSGDAGTGTGVRPRPSASAPSHRPSAPATTAPPSAGAHHGVEAGRGGAFTDSPSAMAAGALLMAGAFGAAVHRLRRRLARPRR